MSPAPSVPPCQTIANIIYLRIIATKNLRHFLYYLQKCLTKICLHNFNKTHFRGGDCSPCPEGPIAINFHIIYLKKWQKEILKQKLPFFFGGGGKIHPSPHITQYPLAFPTFMLFDKKYTGKTFGKNQI